MSKNRRQIIFINKTFQAKLIGKIVLLNIIILGIFGFFLFLFLNSEVESNLHTAHVEYKNIKDMLFPLIITLSVINIIISSAIISFFVLFASHKIAGPLYRFNEALKDMLSRKLDTITAVREDDQLYECSHTLGNAAEILKEDISNIKNSLNELNDLIKSGKNKNEIKKKLKETSDIIDRYRL